MSEDAITIELSKAQIDRVVREAGRDGGLLGLVGVMEDLVGFRASAAQLDDPRFSRSLLRGLMVLGCLPADGAGREVTDVARELETSASTTHRYLSTLVEVGLVERDSVSREYRRAFLR
jgi:DNA-binding MarR family transcriptional regulator